MLIAIFITNSQDELATDVTGSNVNNGDVELSLKVKKDGSRN